jgi:DNA-binding NtrC family response regulator
MRKLYDLVDQLRATDLPILISGETGTGKELVADALHRSSSRRDGPYYSLHCSSLPSQLFESELFGYEAGAFTGAEGPRPGLLEHLRGGTLLLDEITQLPVTTQAKLLQVLDTRLVRPLGSLETRPVDVRFLASTSASAGEAVQAGQLRQDLYYRLKGAEIRVPPLRERIQDLPLLLRHFLKQHASRLERQAPSVTPEAIASLQEHGWPGNVRELEALALRLVLEASPARTIGPEDVRVLLTPTATSGLFPTEVMAGRDLKVLHRELDRAYLLRMFHETRGNVPAMLEALGIRRSNFYTWLRRVGLDVEEMRKGLQR